MHTSRSIFLFLKKPWLPWVFVLTLGLVWLISNHYGKVTTEPITSWYQDPAADCAVVLTGGVGRIHEGLSLLARKLVKKVIISGVHPDVQFQDLYTAAVLMGEVNESDVILERRSQTTFGNAQQSLAVVEALGCRDIVLITSQLHMQRAYATFRGAYPNEFPIFKHTLPASHAERGVWDLSVEIFKSIFYAIWAYR